MRLERQRGRGEFEEVERDRIADEGLTGRGADQSPDLVADALWRVPPALVPAADEVVSPFIFNNLFCSFLCSFGHTTEGVAVEVDEVGVGDDESLAVGGEGILGVEVVGEGEGWRELSHIITTRGGWGVESGK